MGLNLRTLSNCPSLTIYDIIHVGMDLAFHISGYPDIPSLQARAPLNESTWASFLARRVVCILPSSCPVRHSWGILPYPRHSLTVRADRQSRGRETNW